jgi:hypothetical protein
VCSLDTVQHLDALAEGSRRDDGCDGRLGVKDSAGVAQQAIDVRRSERLSAHLGDPVVVLYYESAK